MKHLPKFRYHITMIIIFIRYSKNELPKTPAPTIGVEFGTKVV